MFCWSETSCKERFESHPYWMSSSQWADSMEQGGIFASDGSSGWSASNRIFVKYCRRVLAARRSLPAVPDVAWLCAQL
jgi:hypothetical protein